MNMVMMNLESPKLIWNTVNGAKSQSALPLDRGFATLLGGLMDQTSDLSNRSQFTGSIDELIAQIDQLLLALLGEQEDVENNTSLLLDETALNQNDLVLASTQMLHSMLMSALEQFGTSQNEANEKNVFLNTGLFTGLGQSSSPLALLNNIFTSNQSAALVSETSRVPFSEQLQNVELLQAIRALLVAAKEGQANVSEKDVSFISQALKQFSQGLNTKVESVGNHNTGEIKMLARGFEWMNLSRMTSSNSETPSFQTNRQSTNQQFSGFSSDTNGQTTKAGFHQMMVGTIQTAPQTTTQVNVEEPVVRAQYFQKDMNDFLVRQLQMIRLPNGVSEARIRLFPENLGAVDVKLTVQNGILTAQFVAETRAGKELLDSQLAGLRASLISTGLQVDKLEVSMPNQTNQGQAQDSLNRQGNEQREQHTNDTQREEEPEEDFSIVFEEFSQVI